jgi:MOSC domain-containing protein YiiM
MKVVSVNVGLPREIAWRGETLRSAIFKQPVAGRVAVRGHNLAGDRQADLSVHGGPDKAVYAYPVEHYALWSAELPELALGWGAFGENLSTEGLLETEVQVGDRYRVGSAQLVVTQPRIPCHKLAARHARPDLPKRLLASGRSGFYLRIEVEGELGAGDAIERVSRDERGLRVADIYALLGARKGDTALLRRAVEHPDLAASWREHLQSQLEKQARRG